MTEVHEIRRFPFDITDFRSHSLFHAGGVDNHTTWYPDNPHTDAPQRPLDGVRPDLPVTYDPTQYKHYLGEDRPPVWQTQYSGVFMNFAVFVGFLAVGTALASMAPN